MRRVHVMGPSGSGKTTLAAALATRLGVLHVELDAIHHQRGWEPLPREAFRERVAQAVAGDEWVVDGNYDAVRDLVWARAGTVVLLDLPRPLVTRRIVARSARRLLTREQLWNGNRERLGALLSTDPERNVVLWSWRTHGRYRAEVDAAEAAGTAPPVVRLRTPAEVTAFARGWA